jgi:WhiB family redox-sensing transcriptional regulator
MNEPAPPSKLCADPLCGTVFIRKQDQSDASWKRVLYCDPCSGKRSKGKPVGTPNRKNPTFQAPTGLARGWRHRAACRGEDPELFFAVGTTGPALLQIAEAKTVCRRCPVITECLTYALESGQDAGVYGGMSEDERRKLKRRRRRTKARVA